MSAENARSEVITVRITPAGKQAVIDAAAREERDFSDMVRLLLSRGVDASNKLTTNRTFGATGATRPFTPWQKDRKKT